MRPPQSQPNDRRGADLADYLRCPLHLFHDAILAAGQHEAVNGFSKPLAFAFFQGVVRSKYEHAILSSLYGRRLRAANRVHRLPRVRRRRANLQPKLPVLRQPRHAAGRAAPGLRLVQRHRAAHPACQCQQLVFARYLNTATRNLPQAPAVGRVIMDHAKPDLRLPFLLQSRLLRHDSQRLLGLTNG